MATVAPTRNLASYSVSHISGATLEAEIRTLYSLTPENMKQLASLFAESVVESCSTMVGTSSGEALVRQIGDDGLRSPEHVYDRVDALLGGGSATLKRAIELRFRSKVHRLYKISMSLEAKRLSAP